MIQPLLQKASPMMRSAKPAPPIAHKGRLLSTLLLMLLTTATAWAGTVETFYLDASGTRHDVTATVLDGTETDLAEGTYIATGTLNYTNTTTDINQTFVLRLTGNVTLILEDGCTMNIGTSENRIEGRAISYSNNATLTICGQSTGNDMGTLSCYNTSNSNCISAYEITINGGNVIADASGDQAAAFSAYYNYGQAVFTINGGNVSARASGTHSSANAITAKGNFEFNGGTLTTSTNGGNAIRSSQRRYTFTWRHTTDRITISSGGLYAYYDDTTATFTKLFSSDTDYYGGTLTGDDINTALAGKTITAYAVPYLDENGDTQTCSDYKLLTETTTGITSAPGWRVAFGTLNFTNPLRLGTDVNLILMDGCQMNFGTSGSRLEKQAIIISSSTDHPSLTIYGQTQGSGTLSIYNTGNSKNGISLDAITINGGNVTVDSEGASAKALYAKAGNVTINGGSVSATGGAQGIVASGNITLGWRNNTDRIYASSYSAGGTVSVKTDKKLTDGINIYTDATESATLAALVNKTLYPYIAELSLSANAVDGNYWTTFYCGHTGYKIANDENAWAYTAEYDGANSQLTLHKLGKVIPKNTAVILVGEDNEISMTASTDAAENSVNNNLHGVNVRTLKSTLGDGTFYVLSKKNSDFGFFEYTGDYMPARKAYLLINGGAALARGLTMVFDNESTGITTTNYTYYTNSGEWFTINGVKLTGKPTTKGLYIHNGMKVAIK